MGTRRTQPPTAPTRQRMRLCCTHTVVHCRSPGTGSSVTVLRVCGQAAVDVDSYAIAVIAMVSAVIAAFVYLRIMLTVWTGTPAENSEPIRVPLAVGVTIAGAAVFTLFAGIIPGWLIDATDTVTQYAR